MGSLIINKEFNASILNNVLRKHWYKPLIITSFGLIAAFLYLRYTKQNFETTSTIQIIEEDRVKDVLGDKGVVQSTTDLSEEVELLRSDVLFQQMLRKLKMEISLFSEGKLLTKNLYGELPFSIIMYELKDSSLCGVRINLLADNKNIILSYDHNGTSYKVSGIFNQVINSRHFKLVFRTANPSDVFKSIENNNLYFQINNQVILAAEMKSGLRVEPLDPNAKTIQLSYVHNNPIICYNVVRNLLDVYLNFDKSNKQSKTNQTITFIDQQLDSLSRLVNNSKDSLSDFQRNERIPNPERVESQLSENGK